MDCTDPLLQSQSTFFFGCVCHSKCKNGSPKLGRPADIGTCGGWMRWSFHAKLLVSCFSLVSACPKMIGSRPPEYQNGCGVRARFKCGGLENIPCKSP